MDVILLIGVYLVFINLTGFFLMGIDKKKAVKHAFRIPEATLFIVALVGGSLGCWIGMYTFHHKTRHWYFVYGMPGIFFLQILAVLALYNSPIMFLTL